MPALQTTYSGVHSPAYAGLIADMETKVIISRLVTNAAGAAFGVPVFQTTGNDMGVNITPGTAFRGITVARDTAYGSAAMPTPDVYFQGATAELMVKGVVWVTVTSATTPGVAAYFDSSGNITATASGNTAIVNATFDTTAASGGLAKLRLA